MFDLRLSEQMMMTLLNALGNHPYREAAPVIAELQRQISTQRPMPQGNGKTDQVAAD